MELEGEQLPKATVQQFIKEVCGGEIKCSNDFILSVMGLAKEYIKIVSNESNKICLDQGKKTISGEFVYNALSKLGLDDQKTELKQIEEDVVEETNIKNQNKARFQNEEHLKELEKQQSLLYENAKANNKIAYEQEMLQQQQNSNKERVKLNLTDDLFEQQ